MLYGRVLRRKRDSIKANVKSANTSYCAGKANEPLRSLPDRLSIALRRGL